jgi:UDP-glucose 4-epimerase
MILITGSSGYIGSHITHKLDLLKIKYLGIDNFSYSCKKNITDKKKFIFADIGNVHKIEKILKHNKIVTVIHCAAFSYVMDGEKNKKKYFYNNVFKTKKFVKVCKNNNVKNFIFLSSSNVYKEKNNFTKFTENTKKSPKNAYGKNKLIIEKYLKKKNFRSLVILRLFNIVGLNKKFYPFKFLKNNYQRLIFKFIQDISNNKEIKINYIYKTNKIIYPSRDFVNISDLIRFLIILIQKINYQKINTNLNIGSGKSTTINLIVKLIKNKLNKKVKVNVNKLNKKEILFTRADITKIKKKFNFRPSSNLKKSIISSLKFLQIKKSG